jgi:glycosyltransferase involved in cell wall biosynthesis
MTETVQLRVESDLSRSATQRGALTPFFATAPNPDATRRLLLVFFYFAPSAEVGALRWLSLTKFGADRGWAFDVVALRPEFMGTLDRGRLAQLPPGVRLFGFSGENPTWYRSMVSAWRKLRGDRAGAATSSGLAGHLDGSDLTIGLASPDAPSWRRAFRSHVHFRLADAFARRATVLGSALAKSNAYAAVVSSGPPHAAHDAAMRIGEEHGLPFIMDMRDPWSDEIAMPEELRSNVWRKTATAHESRCVASARLVVVTSESHRQLQLAKYPALRDRVLTVMNGADPDPLPPSRPRTRFVIAFAGMIYLGRDPRALFRAAARVARETGATPDEYAVEFMGDDACEGVPLTRIAAEEGLRDHFVSHGFHPRSKVLEFLSGASLLVSLPLRTSMTLPAKLFEYTRFDGWLLALAERDSATETLLADTDADVVAPDDVDAIARVIAARFAEFRAGGRPRALNRDGRFDRATQSAQLFNALDGVLAPGERSRTGR